MKKHSQIVLLFITLTLSTKAHSQTATINKQKFNVNKEAEDQYGYTQAIKAGNTIYVSGIAAKGPLNEAIKKVYERLGKILASYNATFSNVVKETVFATNIEELVKYEDLKKGYYKGDYPASTWVEIKKLAAPKATLEIEFVVVVD